MVHCMTKYKYTTKDNMVQTYLFYELVEIWISFDFVLTVITPLEYTGRLFRIC
jgi:hypothetical protein